MGSRRVHPTVLTGFAALYFAQGIPLGIAAEYLPVTLRENHASYKYVAALAWLQLPWALKVLWAHAGDVPALRRRSRRIVLGLQLALALTLAGYALFPFAQAPRWWLGLTALAALLASTQDVFVDGLAVRALGEGERGLGNVAQVGAYRLGIVTGGAGLLSAGAFVSERGALLGLAALTAIAVLGVFAVHERRHSALVYARPHDESAAVERPRTGSEWPTIRAALLAMWRPGVRRVLLLAFAFKLGLHAAASLIKPALVDAGWSKERIGSLAVTVGTLAGVLGSLAGGLLHRRLGDRRALLVAGVLQTLSCLPLLLVATHAHRIGAVTAALALEHAASGLGTTVLFAALMGATSERDAALQFTVLATANTLSLGIASAIAAVVVDASADVRVGFALAFVVSAAALPLVRGWELAARTLRSSNSDTSASV